MSTKESTFQKDIIADMRKAGWKLGTSAKYDRKLALYPEDSLTYVKNTQDKTWKKYEKLYPANPEKTFLEKLTQQLRKADPHATDKALRTYGTLGVLRHELRDKSASFKLCQFKPEHGLNPQTQAMYDGNILRIVPELIYSPYTTRAEAQETGKKGSRWRIDLVLFLNGIPIVTLELKSEFKQSVQSAIQQYKTTRLPKDPDTNRVEPLLTFKRGALVHFAVSQFEVHMTTKLAGKETRFLPFNRGTKEGGAGNDAPEDLNTYATAYLWNKVLAPDNLLQIVGRFIHLEINTEEEWDGRKHKVEKLIFPRYHQWDLVTQLVEASREEGPGHKYLVQHSAGSGKSNSIAWTAHQLAGLHTAEGEKLFHTVLVVTDRTVLDDQLQETIYQFEHADGVVGRISHLEGQGSKSEKLAHALEQGQPIIVVTIQTFPFVLDCLEESTRLKKRRYAILADEAHSSQTGHTASKMKALLTSANVDESEEMAGGEGEEGGEEISAEDLLNLNVAARGTAPNISYYAFTATPKSKTLELFGRPPNPEEPTSKTNEPKPFHVYSMRQAIEEEYILDVLKNYTSYKVAYNLAQKVASADAEVDSKKARVKLGQWVRLHDYNIAQKVKVIVEHYREKVMGLLNGQAKAMVVTGGRKEAVRYKIEFDKYIHRKGYQPLKAIVAFSGDVIFKESDPHAEDLLGEKYTESNMNPHLAGRDLRDAFDTPVYHVLIAANKFQTGFDQPKLCAMYVDKKLGGVDCVQTLSRLNRVYPGKKDHVYVLDFVNDPDEVLKAFREYYQTAELLDVSDPNLIWDLYEKLRASGIFQWTEVVQFSEVFFKKGKSQAALINICQPAMERWQRRWLAARGEYERQRELFEHAEKVGDATFLANAENDMKEARRELDALRLFKADLGAFTRYYEFMSQIVDYDSPDLERLSLFARHLAPLLREEAPEEEPVDLSNVELSHYRLTKIRQQELKLKEEGEETGLAPTSALGTGRPRDKKEELLSEIIRRLNDLFVTDGLSDQDMLNYANTIRDKIRENEGVMLQVRNNSAEHALLGGFGEAVDDAVIESSNAHENQMTQYFNSQALQDGFRRLVFDMVRSLEARPERPVQAPAGGAQGQETPPPPPASPTPPARYAPPSEPGQGVPDGPSEASKASSAEPFQRVDPTPEEKWKSALPLVPLAAAAGAFSDEQSLDFAVLKQAPEWVRPHTERTLREGMFIAQVRGHSMEPRIADGAWCLFHAPVTGSREGRIVLAAHRSVADAEHGGRYTVKVYRSVKAPEEGTTESWRHAIVELHPLNPAFEVLQLSADDEVVIVAELIEVL